MKVKDLSVIFFTGCLGGVISVFAINGVLDGKEVLSDPSLSISSPTVPVSTNVVQNQSVQSGLDLTFAAKKAVPAVVHVKTVQMGREYIGNPILDFWFGGNGQMREYPQNVGSGSGVIISSDGYIVTNNHVIQGSDAIKIILNDKREFTAKVVGSDPNTDLALLKIEASGLPTLEFGDSDLLELGEWVLAVGNPYNLTSTVTAGIISAKARGLGGKMNLESFLQTDAAVNPGNSGGALVNTKGKLVGINTAIQSPTGSYSGYSFAVPANITSKVVQDLQRYGKVQRAVLGIRMMPLTPAYAEELGLNSNNGILIVDVLPSTAAGKAGLEERDIITHLNGAKVETLPQFQEQLVRYNPGDKIVLTIIRGDKKITKEVILQNNFGETAVVNNNNEILGAIVEPIDRKEQYRFRLKQGVKIKRLGEGKFEEAGLEEGYIIVKINDRYVANAGQLRQVLNAIGTEGVFVTAVSPRGRVEYFAFSLAD